MAVATREVRAASREWIVRLAWLAIFSGAMTYGWLMTWTWNGAWSQLPETMTIAVVLPFVAGRLAGGLVRGQLAGAAVLLVEQVAWFVVTMANGDVSASDYTTTGVLVVLAITLAFPAGSAGAATRSASGWLRSVGWGLAIALPAVDVTAGVWLRGLSGAAVVLSAALGVVAVVIALRETPLRTLALATVGWLSLGAVAALLIWA